MAEQEEVFCEEELLAALEEEIDNVAGEALPSPAKRQRSESPPAALVPSEEAEVSLDPPDWKVTFSQSVLLKTFCENVGNILTECYFEVVKAQDPDGFSGLSVESIDQGRVCLVQARLSGTVVISPKAPPGPRGFCVRMTYLTSSLKSGHACHFVDLWQPAGSSDVIFRIYEPNVANFQAEYTLKTLAKGNDCQGLNGLEYNLFVEIDLETFRGAVRMAKEHKADVLSVSVYSPKKKGPPGSPNVSFFVLSYEADEVSSRFPYQSSTEPEASVEGKPVVIRANDTSSTGYDSMPPESELETVFSNRFGVEHLFHFVRGMERRQLTLRLGQSKPLLLEYPMGGSSKADYIRFVLAPKLQ